jgi:hypothetical protein
MRKLADSKWSDRFLRKSSIDDALAEYTRMLDEAAQSFQVRVMLNFTFQLLKNLYDKARHTH